MKIYYDNRTNEKILYLKKLLRKALEEVIKYEDTYRQLEVSLSFVTNEEIKEINKEFRDKDKSTDVLSFPTINFDTGKFLKDLSTKDLLPYKNFDTGKIAIGDIVVSLDKIREQAKDYGNSFEKELCLMVIHSMLHLMGYDHMVKNEEKVMFRKQEEILDRVEI